MHLTTLSELCRVRNTADIQEIEKILIENGENLFKTVSCGCIADPAVLFVFSIVVHPLALNRLETYL